MSHVKLVVIVQTDKDDFAARLEALGPSGLMAEQIGRLVPKIYNALWDGDDIRDINGNISGRWDMSEVKDGPSSGTVDGIRPHKELTPREVEQAKAAANVKIPFAGF